MVKFRHLQLGGLVVLAQLCVLSLSSSELETITNIYSPLHYTKDPDYLASNVDADSWLSDLNPRNGTPGTSISLPSSSVLDGINPACNGGGSRSPRDSIWEKYPSEEDVYMMSPIHLLESREFGTGRRRMSIDLRPVRRVAPSSAQGTILVNYEVQVFPVPRGILTDPEEMHAEGWYDLRTGELCALLCRTSARGVDCNNTLWIQYPQTTPGYWFPSATATFGDVSDLPLFEGLNHILHFDMLDELSFFQSAESRTERKQHDPEQDALTSINYALMMANINFIGVILALQCLGRCEKSRIHVCTSHVLLCMLILLNLVAFYLKNY